MKVVQEPLSKTGGALSSGHEGIANDNSANHVGANCVSFVTTRRVHSRVGIEIIGNVLGGHILETMKVIDDALFT